MKSFLFILLLCAPITIKAESGDSLKNVPLSVDVELSSKYMWRGIEYGTAPVIFPSITYTLKDFALTALGAYALNDSHKEVDLCLSYNHDWLTVGISDYYYPSSVGNKDKYFNWRNRSAGHYVELYTTVSPQKIPVWCTLSSYIFGADKKTNDKNAYSTYAEIGYHYDFNADNILSIACGASLNRGFYTDYTKAFSIVNIALKYATAFSFGKFKLPVSASYIINPYKEKSYISFSVYFTSK